MGNPINNLPIILSANAQVAAENLALFDTALAAFDEGAFETVAGDAIHAALASCDSTPLTNLLRVCDRDRNLPGAAIAKAVENTVGVGFNLCKSENRYSKNVSKAGIKILTQVHAKNGVDAPAWMHVLRGQFDALYAVRANRKPAEKQTYEQKFEKLCATMLKQGMGQAAIEASFKAGLKNAMTPVVKAA